MYLVRGKRLPAHAPMPWGLSNRAYRRLFSDGFYRSDQRPLRNVFIEILSDALQDARVG